MEFEALLDAIYEASVVPEMWPVVLDYLAQLAGGVGTFLITADAQNFRWMSSDSVKELGLDFLAGGWHLRNPRMERLVQRKNLGFLREIDMFTHDEMDIDPTFQELLRPRGFGWAAGTVVQVPSNDSLAFSVERRFVDGPIENEAITALNQLRPHLARAAMLSARLGMERLVKITELLSTMGLPSAVVKHDGKVIAANTLFESVGSQICFRAFGRISLKHGRANDLLLESLGSLDKNSVERSAKSIAIPADGQDAAMILHLIPMRRSAHDFFGRATCVLVMTPLGSTGSLPTDLLHGLFDLSPAEIRAANGLLDGKSIKQLAGALGLSTETIRSQVKAVFAKTGTNKQSDLISLLANARMPDWHRSRM